jgi:hypothetical protein
MCDKHEPIIVYDTGGTYKACGKCGVVLSQWTQNAPKVKKKSKKKVK